MTRVIIGLVVFIAVSNAYADDYQDGGKEWNQWIACSSDDECMAIHDECGAWTGINKQYQKEGEDYQSQLAAGAKCLDLKLEPEPKVLCIDQMCTVKPSIGFKN